MNIRARAEKFAEELTLQGIDNYVHYDDFIVTVDIKSGSKYKHGNYNLVIDYRNNSAYLGQINL